MKKKYVKPVALCEVVDMECCMQAFSQTRDNNASGNGVSTTQTSVMTLGLDDEDAASKKNNSFFDDSEW